MRKKIVRSWIEYLLFLGGRKLFRLLPRAAGKRILRMLFVSVGLGIGIRKKVVIEQLRDAFPEKDNKELYRIRNKLYKNLALTSWEMFLGGETEKIEVSGWEFIEKALKLNRGLIVVSGHIGNWELAGRYIVNQGLPLSVVIKRLRNPFFNDYVNQTRAKDGISIIYKNKAMRPVLSALKKNEIVVMLIDQDAGKDGILLPFLNKDASVFTGFARLAERFDTPMILGISLRGKDEGNRFIFEDYVLPSEFKKYEDPLLTMVKYFNNRLEHYIKENPDQWFWVHRRWKRAHKARRS